jgi:DNA repair protein RadD
MKYLPRDYQQEAIDLSIEHIMKCRDSALLDLATGAGKSIIVAYIAQHIAKISGKKILCLAPSTELVLQNREKYLELGEPASIFSAGAGDKCLRNSVIFGSPKTVANSIEKFDDKFSMVIVDEAHGITPTLKNIIESMRSANPNLRVLGLSATCYRMNTGFIYEMDENNKPTGDQAVSPFFKKLLYKVPAEHLIARGFLTPPTTTIVKQNYNTSSLEMKGGKFTADSVDQVFNEDERLTHDIVLNVIEASANRMGVMFFASTIQHANEIMRSLPLEDSEIITGKTPKKERENIIKSFKAMQFKYMVNVSVLTTGFDATHVDVVAILRATESAGLLQQIIGRGLRLHDHKSDCLILDFAENIERHGLEDGLFKPVIKVNISTGEKFRVEATCECCGFTNDFGGRPNVDCFPVDQYGYFVDLMGNQIIDDETKKPFPAHFGRRCEYQELQEGNFVRCNGRWSFKECPHCDHENDIAARYCSSCKGEIIDPNEKLKLEFKKIKKSPYEATSDKVLQCFAQHHKALKSGNIVLKIDWKTEFRSWQSYYNPHQQWLWVPLCNAFFNGATANSVDQFIDWMRQGLGTIPTTITSSKKPKAKFINITAYNQPEEVEE